VTQASYFVKKSSHSGTPIFSPVSDAVVVVDGVLVVVVVGGVVVVVVVLFVVLAIVLEFVVGSDPPQAARANAQEIASATKRKVLLSIGIFSLRIR
jgi:hypothetical protein